jgi:hypothetical protein
VRSRSTRLLVSEHEAGEDGINVRADDLVLVEVEGTKPRVELRPQGRLALIEGMLRGHRDAGGARNLPTLRRFSQ